MRWILGFFVAVALCLAKDHFLAGQGIKFDIDRLDAEEAGYCNEFDGLISGCTDRACRLYEAIQDEQKHSTMGDEEKSRAARNAQVDNHKAIQEHVKDLPRLARTLPPATFAVLHEQLTAFLSQAVGTSEPVDVRDACLALRKVAQDLQVAVKGRSEQKAFSDPIALVYRPKGLPVSVAVPAQIPLPDEFAVEIAVETPAGEFKVSRSNSMGIKKLVIRAHDKDRYFSLSKPFRVFVPSQYGIEVVVEEREALLLEVKDQ